MSCPGRSDVPAKGGPLNEPTLKLKLTEPLNEFPESIFEHAETLEHLDLSGTGLSALPDDFGRFTKLKIAFFSNCNFRVFPRVLASCPSLEMVAFRGNGMVEVPEDSLPPRLRWLILTNNGIQSLPRSIGNCPRLQKCMLSGNELQDLPAEMAGCEKLGLLRLSANRISALPNWLFHMPELAFLSFAGNPCCSNSNTAEEQQSPSSSSSSNLEEAMWCDLELEEVLGEGASGIISRASWNVPDHSRPVAVKLFKGEVTSDGTPLDEMRACMRAGQHGNLIDTLRRISGLAEDDGDSNKPRNGLVMQLVPKTYRTLGLPPSLQSCTRDCFLPETQLTRREALGILEGIASAAAHLHARGVAHGDLYAHNILVDRDHAILGDLGAASIYDDGSGVGCDGQLERLEVLAFAHLIEDVCGLVVKSDAEDDDIPSLFQQVQPLHQVCSTRVPSERVLFADIVKVVASTAAQ